MTLITTIIKQYIEQIQYDFFRSAHFGYNQIRNYLHCVLMGLCLHSYYKLTGVPFTVYVVNLSKWQQNPLQHCCNNVLR